MDGSNLEQVYREGTTYVGEAANLHTKTLLHTVLQEITGAEIDLTPFLGRHISLLPLTIKKGFPELWSQKCQLASKFHFHLILVLYAF